MNHLTEEQIDGILASDGPEPSHLGECSQCRAAVEGRRSMRQRLQGAFESVRTPAGLATRLCQQVLDRAPQGQASGGRPSRLRQLRPVWVTLAAAAVLFLAVTLGLSLLSADPVQAAADALAEIHQANLGGQAVLHAESDPAKAARYLESKLGHAPLAPDSRGGVKLRGSSLCEFQGQPSASYVLDTPKGPVSIVVVGEPLGCICDRDGPTCDNGGPCTCESGPCNIVKVELHGRSYCAVGRQSAAYLTELLATLGAGDAP